MTDLEAEQHHQDEIHAARSPDSIAIVAGIRDFDRRHVSLVGFSTEAIEGRQSP
jgi:hypothetical protein